MGRRIDKECIYSYVKAGLGCVKNLLDTPLVAGNHHFNVGAAHRGNSDDGTGHNQKEGKDKDNSTFPAPASSRNHSALQTKADF
jgi:hypothetical protein